MKRISKFGDEIVSVQSTCCWGVFAAPLSSEDAPLNRRTGYWRQANPHMYGFGWWTEAIDERAEHQADLACRRWVIDKIKERYPRLRPIDGYYLLSKEDWAEIDRIWRQTYERAGGKLERASVGPDI